MLVFNTAYKVSLYYKQWFFTRYNICSAWFLDIRILTCLGSHSFPYQSLLLSTIVLNDIGICHITEWGVAISLVHLTSGTASV